MEAGIAALVAGFGVQVAALANGPVSQVQLIMVMELPFSLILSRLLLGGRLQLREWSAIAAMTFGISVVLLCLSPHGGAPASAGVADWILGLAVTTGVVAGALTAGRWSSAAARTALAGLAAGVTTGLIAVLVKAVTSAFPGELVAILATWQTWALLATAVAGFLLLQNALQAGRLVASQPGITLANPLVAAVWGIAVFDEEVHTGWWLAGAGVGAGALVAGAVLLSRSPLLEGHREAPDPQPQTRYANR